jgi:hypothetical protein
MSAVAPTLAVRQVTATGLLARLLGRCEQSGDCWLWPGAGHRYGHIRVGGRTRLVHRVAYELLIGPIPDGLTLDHLCRTPRCVNPAHLEAVTQQENIRRQVDAYTVCRRGHTMADAYVNADGSRECRACRQARGARNNAPSRARRRQQLAEDPSCAPHGRASTYQNYGCRCDVCRAAQSAVKEQRRAQPAIDRMAKVS